MRRTLAKHLLAATAAIALVSGLAGAQARTPDFTIEQVMSAPFPSGLVAAPAGGAVAWVSDANGTRNVWVATPKAGATDRYFELELKR